MKTSTIMWTFAVLIILFGGGAYYYSGSLATDVSGTTQTTTNEIPNPSGTNLPVGDLAPVSPTPIASSSATTVTSSTTVKVQ